MIRIIKSLLKKYKEIITYMIFGVLTTAVDFGSYFIMTRVLSFNEHFSNVTAQILAIIFAFFTNKKFVFCDRSHDRRSYITQFFEFVSFRLITMLLNSVIFSVIIETVLSNDMLTKTLTAVIVVILNYLFSKLVFKKKEETK